MPRSRLTSCSVAGRQNTGCAQQHVVVAQIMNRLLDENFPLVHGDLFQPFEDFCAKQTFSSIIGTSSPSSSSSVLTASWSYSKVRSPERRIAPPPNPTLSTDAFPRLSVMDNAEVLPLIIFSLEFGRVLTMLGERGQIIIRFFEGVNEAIMGMVHSLM